MPRKKKDIVSEEPKEKKTTLFDLISYLTDRKIPWDQLTNYEKKLFDPYMINRFLSMNLEFIKVINELQKFTTTVMDKKDVYTLLFQTLPQEKVYLNYIKGKKITDDDLNILKKYFKISKRELIDYYNILMKDDIGKNWFKNLKEQFKYEN